MIERIETIRAKIIPCHPPIWAKHGHLQTIFSYLIPSQKISVEGTPHAVDLGDGDQILATYYAGTRPITTYLFHGLGGSTDSNYIQRTAILAHQLGHHVFIVNHRGCGIGAGLAKNPYHSGRAEDLSAVIAYGKNLFPAHQHLAIGFSLSANALLLLAAKVRANVQPDMAIAINGPINLSKASDLIVTGVNKIYDREFLKDLKKYLLNNRPESIGHFKQVKNIKDFDDYYTAPMGGFKSRDDYYEQCSAKQYLHQINIPTLILTAYDDPFVNISDYLEAKYSAQVVLHLEKFGGHIGYLQRKKYGDKRWLDYCLKKYLSELFKPIDRNRALT